MDSFNSTAKSSGINGMDTSQGLNVSSGSSVLTPPPQSEKPQGWQRAQLLKRGYHQCLFDCDSFFPTWEEARSHEDCPNKLKLEEDLNKMEERLREPGSTTFQPLRIWTSNETQKFKRFLKKLPRATRDQLVIEYIMRC